VALARSGVAAGGVGLLARRARGFAGALPCERERALKVKDC
jgi:hypothetical protein